MSVLGMSGVADVDGQIMHVQVVGETDSGRLFVRLVGCASGREHLIVASAFRSDLAVWPEPLSDDVRSAALDLATAIERAKAMSGNDRLLSQEDYKILHDELDDPDRYPFASALVEYGVRVRTASQHTAIQDVVTDPHGETDGLSKQPEAKAGPGGAGEARGVGQDPQDAPGSYLWTPADAGDGISNPGAEGEHDFPWPRKVEGQQDVRDLNVGVCRSCGLLYGLGEETQPGMCAACESEPSDEEREAESGWSGSELVNERWAGVGLMTAIERGAPMPGCRQCEESPGWCPQHHYDVDLDVAPQMPQMSPRQTCRVCGHPGVVVGQRCLRCHTKAGDDAGDDDVDLAASVDLATQRWAQSLYEPVQLLQTRGQFPEGTTGEVVDVDRKSGKFSVIWDGFEDAGIQDYDLGDPAVDLGSRYAHAKIGLGMSDLLKHPRKRPKSPLEKTDKSTDGVEKDSDLNTPSGRDRGLNPSVHEEIGEAYRSENLFEDPDLHIGSKYRRRISSEEAERIANLYRARVSAEKIAKLLRVSERTVFNWLRKQGVEIRSLEDSHRIHSLDETAFDLVTDQSAYWTGFLIADGGITTHAQGSPQIKLNLSAVDKKHVEKFRDFMKSTHKIGDVAYVDHRPDWKPGPAKWYTFASKKVAKALNTLGVTPRKSGTAIVCDSLRLNRHFWRGVVDGDGCLSVAKKDGRVSLSIGGSKPMMQQFLAFAKTVTTTEANVRPHSSAALWVVSLTGRPAIDVIRELYADCTVALDRKHAIARIILARQPFAEFEKDDLHLGMRDLFAARPDAPAVQPSYTTDRPVAEGDGDGAYARFDMDEVDIQPTAQAWTQGSQGKVVVQREAPGSTMLLVMLPNGHVQSAMSPEAAYALARKWFRKNLKTDIGIGEIEWAADVEPPRTGSVRADAQNVGMAGDAVEPPAVGDGVEADASDQVSQPDSFGLAAMSMRQIAQGVDNRLSDPDVHTDVDEQRGDRGIQRAPEDEDLRYIP